MSSIRNIATVAISETTYGFDRRYKYLVPNELLDYVKAGIRVIVPFGRGNTKRIGIVLEVRDINDPEILKENVQNFKPIRYIIDNEPILDDELIKLLFWIRENTFCTYFEAFRLLIPLGLGVSFKQKYKIAEKIPEENIISEKASELFSLALEDIDVLSGEKFAIIKELLEKGYIVEDETVKRRKKDEVAKMISLSEGYLNGELKAKITPKQQEVVDYLHENGSANVKELRYLYDISQSIINALKKNLVVDSYEVEVINNLPIIPDMSPKDIILNDEQKNAYDGISLLVDKKEPDIALLHGVTGSGKTSVFIKLIDHCLEEGKTVIMLLPEIALTPQIVQQFTSLFGDNVSVMHSSLSMTNRLNEYKRIKSGIAKIVVGTRSAIFAPLKNIGLIIMDEEGESSYKSQSNPRYHAKDIAIQRCKHNGSLLLLASATPSIESFYRAKKGIYKLFTIEKRYSENSLPAVEIVDLATEGFYSDSAIFSERLIEEININLKQGEQVILLLNRRGYYTIFTCVDCKEVVTCPNCSVPLTYHKVNGKLICHYCGFMKNAGTPCEKCGGIHFKQNGFGTQKVEDEVEKYFKDARVLRMDADTTYSKGAYEKKFKEFEEQKYDIMLGTQMIAKGLNFPNVTLVGVITIDKALFSGDFRSYEKTFSLITQVVGRSGRGDLQGRALIQTFTPSHYVIELAGKQDYNEFYSQEISVREMMLYPPFCDTCLVEFSSVFEKSAENASNSFFGLIRDTIPKYGNKVPIRVIGPAKCLYEKINNKYRYRMIIKCKNNVNFRSFISEIYKKTFTDKNFANVYTNIDINGDINL